MNTEKLSFCTVVENPAYRPLHKFIHKRFFFFSTILLMEYNKGQICVTFLGNSSENESLRYYNTHPIIFSHVLATLEYFYNTNSSNEVSDSISLIYKINVKKWHNILKENRNFMPQKCSLCLTLNSHHLRRPWSKGMV